MLFRFVKEIVVSSCILVGAVTNHVAFAQSAKVEVSSGLVDLFQRIDQEVTHNSEAYMRLGESIETIGHRLTGSTNGQKAEQYVYDLLKGYGFSDVSFQPFELSGWQRGSLAFQTGSSAGALTDVKAVALAYAPAQVDVHAELVDMGNGLAEDYEADPERARGKIVFAALNLVPGTPAGTSNIHRSSKVAIAAQYGAKGIVLFNRVAGGTLLTGTASIDGTILTIPALSIGLEDGMALKAALADGPQHAKISMENTTGTFTARNVIARLEGSDLPQEKIVVGGHLDSWDLSPGAVDNGLGAFSILDMARTFKALGLKPKRTIEFVFFMGEEQGLLGSNAYVQHAKDAGLIDQIRFMLNFDMTNDPKHFTASLMESGPLLTAIGAHVSAIQSDFTNAFSPRAGLYSDHQPFMLAGIPTGGAGGGRLSRQAMDCYHADCDNFDLINDLEMRNTVRYGAMLAYGIADAPEIPVQRLREEQIKQLLLDNNLKEPLVISGDWRWD